MLSGDLISNKNRRVSLPKGGRRSQNASHIIRMFTREAPSALRRRAAVLNQGLGFRASGERYFFGD